MIIGFESFTPEAWSDADGLMLSSKVLTASAKQGKVSRSGAWNAMISVGISGVCFAFSSLIFAALPSAVAMPTLAYDLPDIDTAKPDRLQTVTISPIREINRSFNNLFDSVRAGEMLIPSDRLRTLAQKAVQSQKEDVEIDSWARRLAADIKDADD